MQPNPREFQLGIVLIYPVIRNLAIKALLKGDIEKLKVLWLIQKTLKQAEKETSWFLDLWQALK